MLVLLLLVLRPYSAVMFNTTRELPLDESQKQAFLDFVKRGGGFLGVHSATDTFYKWPTYAELVGPGAGSRDRR